MHADPSTTVAPDQCRCAATVADKHKKSPCACNHAQVQDAPSGSGVLDALDEERRFVFEKQFPKAKFKSHVDCDRDRHIWSDLDLQLNHFSCCRSESQQNLLRAVYRKTTYTLKSGTPGYWNNQTAWDNYAARASIIALSNYEHRVAFCLCGLPRRDGSASTCNDVDICPRCDHRLRRQPMLDEYEDCFTSDQESLFITLSLTSDQQESMRIVYKDLTKSEMEQITAHGLCDPYLHRGLGISEPLDYLQHQVYWELYGKVMGAAVNKRHHLSGAFGSAELAVRFLPLGAIPHAHCIAFSSGFCSDFARDLRRALKKLIRQTRRITDKLHPSVAVYRIRTAEDYRRVIGYIFKPIKIEQAYEFAALKMDYKPEVMAVLNNQVNICFEGVESVFYGVRRVYRYGICQPNKKGYCGHVTPERMAEREAERERRHERKEEAQALESMLPGYRHARRKRSTDERHERREKHFLVERMIRDGELPPKRSRRVPARSARPTTPPAKAAEKGLQQRPDGLASAQPASPKKTAHVPNGGSRAHQKRNLRSRAAPT